MQGIFFVLDAYNIDRSNPAKAVQAVNALNLTLKGANDYLRHAVELQDEETMPYISDVTEARTVLAYMVQVGLQRNKELFSLEAFQQFAVRAKGVQPVAIPQPIAPVIEAVPVEPIPVVAKVEAVPVLVPAPVAIKVEPKPIVEVAEKKKRTRRIDPNSNLQRAKNLYQSVPDKSRDAILDLFKTVLGLDGGTAMTYYYIARKG